jgi:CBS domain-containing protein
MKVQEIMTPKVRTCAPSASLAEAAQLLWEGDCGILPVVEDGRLTGVITDRDVCIALGTRAHLAGEVTVGELARTDVVTCAPEASLESVMGKMREARVRRLPVVEGGAVVGIISLNDLILAAQHRYGPVDYELLLSTLRAVSEHPGHTVETAPLQKTAQVVAVA